MDEVFLKVTEITPTIDGEVNVFGQGYPTTIIRLAGCNLKCSYCDTKFDEYTNMKIPEILSYIKTEKVTITGGEPLLQSSGVKKLLHHLFIKGIYATIETNGTLPIIPREYNSIDVVLGYVIDFKLHEANNFCFSNLSHLDNKDWIKFVISDYKEYRQSLVYINMIRQVCENVNFALSPVMSNKKILTPNPYDLLHWMLDDKETDIDINIQLHKLVNMK